MYQTPAYIFKRLVFAYYCSEKDCDKIVCELHLKMLERYINIFDDVIFCFITDGDDTQIKEIEKTLLKYRNGNISFKIYENTNYRETFVFYNEIFLKMKDLNGVTFFGHSKGWGNLYTVEELVAFISAAYFFSLEDLNDVHKYPFYGSLKMVNNSPSNSTPIKHNWFYVGTFFWGNYQLVYNDNKNKLPLFTNRWFNECFPGNLYPFEECGSFNKEYIDATEKPINSIDLIKKIHGENNIMDEYILLYNNLLKCFK